MIRLAQAILEGGALDGHRILTRASVATMLTAHHAPAGPSAELDANGKPDVRHGLAWFVVRDGDHTY